MNRVIRPRAQDDILRQFRWYLVENDASDAAFRFAPPVFQVEFVARMVRSRWLPAG